MSVERRLRVGIVGVGSVAQAVYLPLLARHEQRFEVAGICDLSVATRDAVAQRHRLPRDACFPGLEQMLDDGRLDALIVLASGSHGEPALAGLRAGLHVLCEKPLAYTLAEADALAETSAASGARLMLAYMKLYDPAVVRARQIAAQRPPARAWQVTVLHPPGATQLEHVGLLRNPEAIPVEAQLRTAAAEAELLRRALGGEAAAALGTLYSNVLLGSLVHDLAVLRFLGSDLERVDYAERWPADTWPPSVLVQARLGNGEAVTIAWHYLERYPAYREEVRRHDEAGSISLIFPSPYLLHAPTELSVTEHEPQAEVRFALRSTQEAFEEQLLAFHRFVVDGTPPPAGIPEGRAEIMACQRIAAAIAERERIAIGGEAAASAVRQQR